MVGVIEAFGFLLGDLDHADDTAGAAVAVGGERDDILEEVFRLLEREVVPIELVEVPPDERRTRPRQRPVTLLEKACLVHTVDLIALVGVPARANHAS